MKTFYPVCCIFVTTLILVTGLSCASESDEFQKTDRPSSGTVFVDGAELSWQREGKGPTVFVIGSTISIPRAYSAQLRDHFELVFVDGRHFVPNYAPDTETLSDLELSTFADDVEAVREALGYDEIVVLGHSIHGQIALEYADRYPQNTSKVLLIGAVPYVMSEFAEAVAEYWEEQASEERKAILESRLSELEEKLSGVPESRSFAVWYVAQGPRYWADPEYDATGLFEGLETGPAWGSLFQSLPTRNEARSRLERIQAPILLVLGKLDYAIPHTVWENLIEDIPNIKYILLEEDSHNPQTESPNRFDPIMIDWVTR